LHHKILHPRTRNGAVVASTLLVLTAATGPADPGAAIATATTADGFRPHLLASPFGTIDAPTFRFPGLTATGVPAEILPAPADAVPDRHDAGAVAPSGAAGDAEPAVRVAAIPEPPADTPGTDESGSSTPATSLGEPPQGAVAVLPAPDAPARETDRRPKTPAELLNLSGETRARHERCLANAIYFEARGESVLGQMAVAQVVINRVFSGHYPGNVCGVVYQSTRRYHRLRCQFSFTCDGIPDHVTEPDAFARATRIARNALDGRFWVDDVGKATHYHARWVHPRWVHEMRRLDRIGVHTFYRPRRWGSGAAAPAWGDTRAAAADQQ